MHTASEWQLDRSAAGVAFDSRADGFDLDTRNGADDSHTRLSTTFVVDNGDRIETFELLGAVDVAGGSERDRPYMGYKLQYFDAGGAALGESAGKLQLTVASLGIPLGGEQGSNAAKVRFELVLNKIFKLRTSLRNVRLEAVEADSPRQDTFRRGYAWPGTTSMRWLDGRSMYLCAGCELTYVKEFLEQSGLLVHHTFDHHEAMDPLLEAANPGSELWRTRPDFMVLSTVQNFRSLLSSYEQRRAELPREQLEQRLDEYTRQLAHVIARLRENVTCPIWLVGPIYTATSAYGIHDYRIPDGSYGTQELILLHKLKLYGLARSHTGVYVLDPDIALESRGKGSDPAPLIRRNETLGGHPEREGARYVAEYLHHHMQVISKHSERVKCVVVDCDNTLWRGVIREDGAARIEIDKLRFQRLWQLGLRGIPIALCTKNDPEDLKLIMEAVRSYGRLHEKIVATRVDWNPKSVGIRSIAQQLNIGIDAIALFDDSAFEREEVTTNLPEVRVFPETAIDVAPDWHIFEPLGDLTVEALDRVDKYRTEAERSDFEATFSDDAESFEQFLHSCELRLDVRPSLGSEIARVSELLQRTNQMNATLKRLESAEVIAYHERDTRAIHIVKLGDKFGDYGIIGAALSRVDDDQLAIVELALSCRAMGRRVEDALLEELIGYAADAGLQGIRIDATRTSRNQQIIETLERVGFSAPDDPAPEGQTETWTLELDGRRGRDFAPWFAIDTAISDLD